MARSPFMTRLTVLARAQQEANRRGVDIDEVLGTHAQIAASDEGMTRRDLMKKAVIAGAGVTAAGAIIARPAHAAGRAVTPKVIGSQPSIAIIGAGVAGMSAAMQLKDAGFTNITVYEAGDRVGGRTYTRKNDGFWEAGQWSEWGGELIDSTHKNVFTLCKRFGFGVSDLASGADDTLWFDGGYYSWADMVNDWKTGKVDQAVTRDMQTLPPFPWTYQSTWSNAAKAIDDLSLAQWIDTRIPGGRTSRLGKFIDVAYNIEFGEEVSRQGATDLLALLGFSNGTGAGAWWVYGKSDERWKINGGNQQISLAQADYLGWQNIQLGWKLTALKTNANGTVTATFNVGGTSRNVTADQIVLAVPLGILKQIKAAGGFTQAWSGAQGALKNGFIDNLGFGANNKLQLQIADRFWAGTGPWGTGNGESYSDSGYQEAWHVTAGQPGSKGIINNYTGGDVSRLLSAAAKPFIDTNDASSANRAFINAAAQTFLSQVEPVFPGMTAKWTGKATLSVWHKNPLSLGAYAYWKPGYMRTFAGSEAAPYGAIHFAGEHTSTDFQGYIEGGIESGLRCASEITALY